MEACQDDAHAAKAKRPYTTPRWVQVWFLGRSRDRWKQKYKALKVEAKRLQNRAADARKARDQWRDETERLRRRVGDLEAENAGLREQSAALKKYGTDPRS